jgi:hypothetical protein
MNYAKVSSISVLAIVIIMIAVGFVSSFVSIETTRPHRRSTSIGIAKRNEITDAIKSALAITNKYGVASYKTVMAWKTVEEIDYSTNLDEEVVVHYNDTDKMLNDLKCDEEFDTMLNDLKSSLETQESINERMKSMASEIKVSVWSRYYFC